MVMNFLCYTFLYFSGLSKGVRTHGIFLIWARGSGLTGPLDSLLSSVGIKFRLKVKARVNFKIDVRGKFVKNKILSKISVFLRKPLQAVSGY